ncbi:Hypothetical protein FKW44_020071, partial [Caligus rogercresseyi]
TRTSPPPGFILPGDPILVVPGTTEVPPNPRVLVPLGLGGAEAGLDGSHGARISTPPCEADDEEDDYPDGVQLQTEA